MKIKGLPVVNATKEVIITIMPKDIKKGNEKDPGHCAAALAFIREVTGCTEARVHLSKSYIRVGKQWLRYNTPTSVRSEIIGFDSGGTFAPGDYVFKALPPSHRYDRHKVKKRKMNRGAGKPRRPYHHLHGIRTKAMSYAKG